MIITLLQPMLGIALGDLRLVCSCSAMETHFMKLPMNSSCAEVASRGNSELGRVLQPRTDNFCALRVSALGCPVLRACVAYHFAAEQLLILDVSSSK